MTLCVYQSQMFLQTPNSTLSNFRSGQHCFWPLNQARRPERETGTSLPPSPCLYPVLRIYLFHAQCFSKSSLTAGLCSQHPPAVDCSPGPLLNSPAFASECHQNGHSKVLSATVVPDASGMTRLAQHNLGSVWLCSLISCLPTPHPRPNHTASATLPIMPHLVLSHCPHVPLLRSPHFRYHWVPCPPAPHRVSEKSPVSSALTCPLCPESWKLLPASMITPAL